jgi:hypothetical protein
MVSFVSSVELWNGFTTEMTIEMAIERANKVLSPSKIQTGEDSSLSNTVPSYDDLGYPEELPWVGVYSQLPEYGSGSIIGNHNGNIVMYFYNGKLFSISINWKYQSLADSRDEVVAKMAKSRYGNPTKTIEITNWRGSSYNVYYWKLSGKDFYSALSSFIVVDCSARERWALEKRRRIENERAQRRSREAELEAERQREVESNIHF